MQYRVQKAIELWDKMTVDDRTAFVQYLAADTSVTLYTEEQVQAKIKEAIDAIRIADKHAVDTANALKALMPDSKVVALPSKYIPKGDE